MGTSFACSSSKMSERLKTAGWTLMTYLALLTAAKSTQYLTGNPNLFDPLFREKYLAHWPIIATHAICAITALVIGPFQFIAKFRIRFPAAHRVLGRIYMIAILFGGLTGFFMGTMAFGGIVTQIAFCSMAIAGDSPSIKSTSGFCI